MKLGDENRKDLVYTKLTRLLYHRVSSILIELQIEIYVIGLNIYCQQYQGLICCVFVTLQTSIMQTNFTTK